MSRRRRNPTDHTALYVGLGLGAAVLVGGVVLLTRRSTTAAPGPSPLPQGNTPTGSTPTGGTSLGLGDSGRLPQPLVTRSDSEGTRRLPPPPTNLESMRSIAARNDPFVTTLQQALNARFVLTPPLIVDGGWGPATADTATRALATIALNPEGYAPDRADAARYAFEVMQHRNYDTWVAGAPMALRFLLAILYG